MKRTHLLAFLTLFLVVTSYGQTNFSETILYKNNGDSLKGQIDYRNWKLNPGTILFYQDGNAPQEFKPTDLKGFYVVPDKEYYLSEEVEIDQRAGDPVTVISANSLDKLSIRQRIFLLQLVYTPSYSLYLYEVKKRDHFYYRQGSETPVELIHHYLYNPSSQLVSENNFYRQQLAALFNKCAAKEAISERSRYRRKDLQSAFLKYLECSVPSEKAEVKKSDPLSVQFGILAGISKNSFSFKGENTLLQDDGYTSSTSILAGAMIDVGLSRNFQRWHIVNELMYKSYKTGSVYSRPYGSIYTAEYDVKLHFSYIQLNTMLRYVIAPLAPVNGFITAGAGNAFMIAENENNMHIEFSFVDEKDQPAIDGPRKYEVSFQGGAGLIWKNIQAEFRYAGSKKGFSPTYTTTNPRSLQFIFTYRF
jgi:hypothetical protein